MHWALMSMLCTFEILWHCKGKCKLEYGHAAQCSGLAGVLGIYRVTGIKEQRCCRKAACASTCLEQSRVWVDGCDGLDTLSDNRIADGVACVGFPQSVAQHCIHVVRRGLVPGSKVRQDLEQLDLHRRLASQCIALP